MSLAVKTPQNLGATQFGLDILLENATLPVLPEPVRILVRSLRFIDDFTLVPFLGSLICLLVAILIPLRLYGRSQFKKSINIFLMISCWFNVFACCFQVLADILDPSLVESQPKPLEIWYMWSQNVAMFFLFLSRKMGVIIAIYWMTYSTHLNPEHKSNRHWWLLHLVVNIPYCLVQAYINLSPVIDFIKTTPHSFNLDIVSMVLGISCQISSIITVAYCLYKVGRKLCSEISLNARNYYIRISTGLALKTLALLIPIVESASLTRDLIFSGAINFTQLKEGDTWAVTQVVIHLLREFYPTMDSLITLAMLWRIIFPKPGLNSLLVESSSARKI